MRKHILNKKHDNLYRFLKLNFILFFLHKSRLLINVVSHIYRACDNGAVIGSRGREGFMIGCDSRRMGKLPGGLRGVQGQRRTPLPFRSLVPSSPFDKS